MAVLYTPHFMQFFDNNGDPLAGGLLYTYEAGTTTPKATYTTAAGDTPNANPVVLDSSGRATIFIDGSYKFRLETALGVLVRETDNISSFDTASASSGVINWATADTLASAGTVNIGAATSNYIIITGTTTINAFDTIAQGAERLLRFNGSLTITHNSTSLILPNNQSITTNAGDCARFISEGSGNWRLTSYISAAKSLILRNHISGYQMSTAGSSATLTIGAGQASDSTNAASITLPSSISKTTSAWAVGTGNGGLDTGTIVINTWYHFYAIRRPDTGVVDVVFSTNATTPTLPTNYTQYRRIGSAKTNGSAQWVKFTQIENRFIWTEAQSLDVDATDPGSSPVTRALNVPTGVVVRAQGYAFLVNTTSSDSALITPLYAADSTVTNNAWPLNTLASSAAGGAATGYFDVDTNTSAQVRTRMRIGTATTNFRMATHGWVDYRGENA